MPKQAVVIIPVYKPLPDRYEEISFRQCIKILSKHPLCIVTFSELNIDWYKDILQTFNVDFSIEYFDKTYFESLSGYNKLMLSKQLYQRFMAYEYMLIYQLDAYVFRDELEYWCRQGYDYIGAPWFEGWKKPTKKFKGVGNGGFSLRNIQTSLSVLNKLDRLKKYNTLYTQLKINKLTSFYGAFILFRALLNLKKSNGYTFYELISDREPKMQEDGVWALNVPSIFDYKVAPVEEALKFSFETNPSLLYEMNDNRLPFGCHAWLKYESEFWQPFIKYD